MKASDIPWQLAVLVASLLLAIVLLMFGYFGYEIKRDSNGRIQGLVNPNDVSSPQQVLLDRLAVLENSMNVSHII